MRVSLPVVNLAEVSFECSYGRGCEGLCCRDSRPPLYAEEAERVAHNLPRFLPLLRPEAREVVERDGFLSNARKGGLRRVRVVGRWCVFFNGGCVLHKVGAAEGDKGRYKPFWCAVFPLGRDHNGEWYVRQRGYRGEQWDLPCLDPRASATPAGVTLREEVLLIAHEPA
jgi:hypothetical protein